VAYGAPVVVAPGYWGPRYYGYGYGWHHHPGYWHGGGYRHR
jgi:hypothetical protein